MMFNGVQYTQPKHKIGAKNKFVIVTIPPIDHIAWSMTSFRELDIVQLASGWDVLESLRTFGSMKSQ